MRWLDGFIGIQREKKKRDELDCQQDISAIINLAGVLKSPNNIDDIRVDSTKAIRKAINQWEYNMDTNEVKHKTENSQKIWVGSLVTKNLGDSKDSICFRQVDGALDKFII